MRIRASDLLRWDGTIERGPYALLGVVLAAVKYTLDGLVATQVFGRPWSPWGYLVMPDEAARLPYLPSDERLFYAVLLVIALPFIWAGVGLTLRRLRDAGLPLALVILFFVPLINLLFFVMLSVLPSRRPEIVAEDVEDPLTVVPVPGRDRSPAIVEPVSYRRLEEKVRAVHKRVVPDNPVASAAASLLISVPLTLVFTLAAANVLGNYGWALFVGSPFVLGLSSVLLFGLTRPRSFGSCMLVALVAGAAAGVGMLFVALEGAICLILATPILFPLVFLGGLVGFAIQARPWASFHTPTLLLALTLTLPALLAAESAGGREPALLEVCTAVEIDAPPERVWRNVVAFPPLPEPDDWLFRAGVAYPTRAEIHGTGVGAVRHCVFSTGTFVEPIEVWDAPRLLRFAVTDQPQPMTEWSPYSIHPPHLQHYLVSRRGQFLLTPLPGGRTRLEGTTWYTNRMWPAPYWQVWSDAIIHRIHGRVLDHIRQVSEAAPGV
jgi:uncharacterized membrane protein YhaH (DUF805 family)